MKRIFLFVLSFVITVAAAFTASAENITLSTNLAQALQSAQLQDANGNTVTATASGTTLTLSSSAASVAAIDFDTADLSGITSGDFASFDVFTGLEELRIALPASYSGDFAPSFDKLKELDVSGSTADFTLSLYNAPNIVSVNASGCSDLKAVDLALVRDPTASTDLVVPNSSYVKTVSKLVVVPLSSLETLYLSDNPKLNRLGYALHSEIGIVHRIDNGTERTDQLFDNAEHRFGYMAHGATTTVKSKTTFKIEDTSYPVAAGSNPISSLVGGGTGTEIAQYTGNNINLTPALRILNLKNSGIDTTDYISVADLSETSSLVSADLSGMTSLYDFTVPAGSSLKSLNLTGDTGLTVLDLSGNTGFTWPEGFNTLTNITDFKMTGRSEIDSIDITQFTKLKNLDLTKDSIEALDVRNNLMLEHIIVPNNRIQSLDFSKHERIKSIDIRNNSLTMIDLSKNINIRVNKNSSGNAAISLSPQTRYMTGTRSRTFSFRELGMTSQESARVIMDSLKGGGVEIDSYDPMSGVVTFKTTPSVIEYDYNSGIYYEGSVEPLCMTVRLVWDVSGRKPVLTPIASAIRGNANSAVTPITITADSETPVTWTTEPVNLPAGLTKSSTEWTLTISGEPSSVYSGVVTVTAQNVNGVSEPATVSIVIESASVTPTPSKISKPTISPLTSNATGRVGYGAITPLIITAESSVPVTWTTEPATLPAGLTKVIGSRTLVISGEPDSAYSGTVIISASNSGGTSEPASVSIEITDPKSKGSTTGVSSSGGCYAGNITMAVSAIALVIMRRKR